MMFCTDGAILKESGREQCQEVICKQEQKNVEEGSSHLTPERQNNPSPKSKNSIDVKDGWLEIRVTLDTGAAGHGNA